MVDVFRESTREGYGSRLKGALGGLLVGLAMFVGAFPLQWWNEGRAVRRTDSLNEGAAAVVAGTAARVDPALEGRLVHLSGRVAAPAPLADDEFGVSVDALALERRVEMYQWREKRESKEQKKIGGGTETVTEYRYSLDWSSDRIDSSGFRHAEGHENPAAMPLPSRKLSVDKAQLGAYTLDAAITQRFDDWRRFDVPAEAASSVEGFRRVESGGFYRGADPKQPQVGDVRVRFRQVPEGDYSFVAKQSGAGLAEYRTKSDDGILLIEGGTKDAKQMFATAHRSNTIMTWIVRGIGFALMWIGLSMVLRPLAVLADVIPIVGTILSKGLGLVAFVFAAFFSMLTIGLAWLAYRPVLGVALLVVGAAFVFWLRSRKPRAPPGVVAQPPPPPTGRPLAAMPPPPPAS